MVNSNPLVSIIVPAYNRASLIGETLESVKSQTYQNWECIVVDDGSMDETIEIVKNNISSDGRIKLLFRTEELKGAPTCRNIGIKNSSGKYLIFLDSDDLLASKCLENRVSYFNKHSELNFIVFPQLVFSGYLENADKVINIKTTDNDILRFLTLGINVDVPWVNSAPIWNREILIKKNLKWNESTKGFQDVEFHLNAIIKGCSYQFADSAPDCFYRLHDADTIGKDIYSPATIKSTKSLLISIYEKLGDKNLLTTEIKNRFVKSYFHVVIEKEREANNIAGALNSALSLRKLRAISFIMFLELGIYIRIKSFPIVKSNRMIARLFKKLWENKFYKIESHNYMQHKYAR